MVPLEDCLSGVSLAAETLFCRGDATIFFTGSWLEDVTLLALLFASFRGLSIVCFDGLGGVVSSLKVLDG